MKEKKGQNRTMCLLRADCYPFQPLHQTNGARYVERKVMSSNGVDACFSNRRERRAEEEVAGMERALASFHAAVAKDYGFEEAAKAAEDWIEEFEKACADRHPDWRSVTARAAYRLALRVGAGENSGSMEGIQKNGNQTNWLATLC